MTQKNEEDIGEQHLQFLRALYGLGENSYLGQVYVHRLGQELGLHTVAYESHRDELAKLARELDEAGYLSRSGGRYMFFPEREETEPRESESRKEGYGYLALTDEGRRRVEEEKEESQR